MTVVRNVDRRKVWVAIWLLSLAACERSPECPDVHYGEDIAVPAIQTTVTVEQVNAQTSSAAGDVMVSITNNRGSIMFEGSGPIDAFVFQQIPYPATQSTLYEGLGMGDEAWFPFWLYCSPDGRLTKFAGEMTDQDLGVLVDVDGTCSGSGASLQLALDLPAHRLSHVALTCGFQVTSPPGPGSVSLAGSMAGQLDFGGAPALVLPFHTVDCRTGCGAASWYEIHSIVSIPADGSVAFAIFYLDSSEVSAQNGFLLPTGSPFGGTFPTANWTLSR